MDGKTSLTPLNTISTLAIVTALTFIAPMTQWLVGQLVEPTQYVGLISNSLISLCIFFWHREAGSFSLLTVSNFWERSCYLIGSIVLILLIINISNQPISKITGQARSLFEVADVIVLSPIAEEFVFRGVIWSIFERLARNNHWRFIMLTGTSLLFGVEHLGYWALSHWPLPPDAIMHALLMIGAGIWFGGFRLASRSLMAPMSVHMLANGAILLTQ